MKKKGCWYVKYWGGGTFTKSGIPDLLICCNGYFLAVELKGSKGKVSELQNHQIEQIKKAGGIAMVLYPKDFDEFQFLIDELIKE